MKTAMISMMMAGIVTFTVAAKSEKIELPKSGSVILTTTVGENAYQYEVLLKTSAGKEIKLSSVKVKVMGRLSAPQGEVRYLISCDENSDKVVVLLGTSPWTVILLQYDLATKVVREDRFFAGRLMEDRRNTDGKVSVHAPNRITLSAPNGTSQSWSVVDGNFFDENGNIFAQNEGFAKYIPTLETTPQKSPANTVPAGALDSGPPASTVKAPPASLQNEEPASSVTSTPWSVVLVLIVAAIGLLWLLFKRRS